MPDVPPRLLSFQHPEGELHIASVDSSGNNATMVACPGQENDVRHFLFVSPCCSLRELTRLPCDATALLRGELVVGCLREQPPRAVL